MTHRTSNVAQIRITACKYFPNGDELESYIRNNNIRIKESKYHPDAIIDNTHIDNIIRIILGDKNKKYI